MTVGPSFDVEEPLIAVATARKTVIAMMGICIPHGQNSVVHGWRSAPAAKDLGIVDSYATLGTTAFRRKCEAVLPKPMVDHPEVVQTSGKLT